MLDLIYWPNSLKSQFNAQSLERFLWIYRVCFAIVCDSGTCKMQIYFKMFFFPFEKEKKTLSSTCEYDTRECVPFFVESGMRRVATLINMAIAVAVAWSQIEGNSGMCHAHTLMHTCLATTCC